MTATIAYGSEEQAYQALVNAFWMDAPGALSESAKSSEVAVLKYLGEPDKITNASVALNFFADDELLLAGNLIARGCDKDGWEWVDKSVAHAHLGYQVFDHCVWMPSAYTRQIFNFGNFCSRFALILARGDEQHIQWYAQQVYNLIQGGLADECCTAAEYVDFYFDIAVSVLRKEWRTDDQLTDRMEIYRELFMSAGDENRVEQALLACARYHLQLAASVAPKNEDESAHPFRSRSTSHIAYELMAYIALYKRFHGPLKLTVNHPMLMSALLSPPDQKPYTDTLLERLYANAKVEFGESWLEGMVPNIDDIDEAS